MPFRRFILGYDVFMGLASSIIAFIVAYYSFRAYAATRERYFLLLQLGFMLAGIGLLLESLMNLLMFSVRIPLLIPLGYTIYFTATLAAYLLILGSYVLGQLRKPVLYAIPPFIGYSMLTEAVLMLPLSVVVAQSAMNLAANKSLNPLLVFLAFTLLLLSHLAFLLHIFVGVLLPAGHILRFTGFLIFGVFLSRVVKIE